MGGEREYGFAGTGVVAADGNSRSWPRTLTAGGCHLTSSAAALRRRLTAWGIMHR